MRQHGKPSGPQPKPPHKFHFAFTDYSVCFNCTEQMEIINMWIKLTNYYYADEDGPFNTCSLRNMIMLTALVLAALA